MPPGYSSIASTKSLLESKFAFRMMEMTAENSSSSAWWLPAAPRPCASVSPPMRASSASAT